jgi:hypothetical protein
MSYSKIIPLIAAEALARRDDVVRVLEITEDEFNTTHDRHDLVASNLWGLEQRLDKLAAALAALEQRVDTLTQLQVPH